MRLFVLFGLLLFLGGCSESLDKKIAGRWQEVGNPKGAFVFYKDHTGVAYWPDELNRQQSEPMKWEIHKENSTVSVITPPGPVIFQIKNDQLIAPNGVVLNKIQ